MAHSLETKEQAIALRTQGYSLTEIASSLNIAKSTTSLWLRNIPLDNNARHRIANNRLIGKQKASLYWKRLRQNNLRSDSLYANNLVNSLNLTPNQNKLILAILFWTEGSKTTRYVSFINSDPTMITTFLCLLRKCYKIDETKLRALLHAHEYHDIPTQKEYWRKLTNIPFSQFSKTYLKPHTGKRKRNNYPGSLRIR